MITNKKNNTFDDTFDINIHIFMDDFLHITMIKMMNNKKKPLLLGLKTKRKNNQQPNSKIDLCYSRVN